MHFSRQALCCIAEATLLQVGSDPALTAGNLEQPPVFLCLPTDIEAMKGERLVERRSVTVTLGIGQSAVHVENHRRQSRRIGSDTFVGQCICSPLAR